MDAIFQNGIVCAYYHSNHGLGRVVKVCNDAKDCVDDPLGMVTRSKQQVAKNDEDEIGP